MNKCQFANVISANWLLLIGINLLGGIFLSTSVAIKAASAIDKEVTDAASKELATEQKAESTEKISQKSQHPSFKLKQRLIQFKQQQILNQQIDASRSVGDTFGEAKKLSPTQNQTITQQIDASGDAGDRFGSVNKLRQDLLVEPLFQTTPPQTPPQTPPPKRTYQPGLSFGAPSAFGAAWGDLFIGASGATAGKSRDGNPDASMSAGFGIGDAYNLIGLELTFNNGSIKNFGYNGTFDLKAHRVVYVKGNNQVAVAAGWNAFAQYGNEGIRPSGAYGVVTTYSLLQPDNSVNPMAISFSLGAGGGDFRQGNDSTGVFAGVGLQVHPQIGMGFGWSGVGLNAGVSFVPVPTIPLIITAQGADLTDNSFGGRIFVLTVGYGFNFLPR
ncbi:hypothetical protein H6G54_26930 [Anabaena cylindrica FACHB-243]|uniref:Uncharacterized protein n=1 Tax=Anabaena cylindrica (strain ATCC 27899 / PCC 7122) TaxID=272123 RepID=K9ZAR8_ANACC|nr:MULTISPECIES: hypothetical protein [Anabaena]AFZ55829.1 hypothetical protein Anacy_0222 [Anabaena cylindrica PCC 7122]MBD2421250.1 hypothetical protein [Anabaena cylindrica FACHB-243]MBY5284135.1 hypothetical protein [Anabaena sp. CCAP 1446/1C]MBY5308081.1 hypothetical protein [Anabaena sp. CCAP 1446/1C]MCM2406581.1 hypothetical protein [Anabaena sp. CCAP 1446/1C]